MTLRFLPIKKYLHDYEYYGDYNISSTGMIITDQDKNIIAFDGVVFKDEIKQIGIFRYNLKEKEEFFINSDNKEFIKEIIYDILYEINKEGL